MKSKEIRYLAFIIASIVLAILMCITTINSGSMFGIIVSIFLLALLSIGLGYLYCKYEEKIFVALKGSIEEAEEPVVKEERVIAKIPTLIKKVEDDFEF